MSQPRRVWLRWLDGAEARLDASPAETVLEAAERAGVDVPFGCRTGACGTCTGRLTAGRVTYRRPPRALKERHIRDGFVLLCIATPCEDCRFDVGVDVQSQLVSNPWRAERGTVDLRGVNQS